MHRYQVWVTCAILLALAPLSGLHGKQVQPSANNNRHIYSEDFSNLSNLDYLQSVHLDTEKQQLTLQLDDHVSQQEPVVVPHEEGIYVIWRDLRNDQGDIYIQMLDANGQRMWLQDRKINDQVSAGTTQSNPAAAMDSEGNLWVVWVDDRNGNNDLYAQYLRVQADPADGFTALSDDLPIPQNTDTISLANQTGPAVTTYETDLIIAWHDNRNGTDFDIYAQKIGTNGQSLWPSEVSPIHTNAIGSQSDPTIAIDSTGNLMVAWLDQRVGNGDIYYTQRSLSRASSTWSTEQKANQTEYSARKPPVLVMDSAGVAQICWISSTNIGNHIYLQTVDVNTSETTPLSNRMITTASVNSGTKPAATLLGNQIAVGWKAINDGHLYVDVGNVDQVQGIPVPVKIDNDGADGSNNRSQNLSLVTLNDNELFAVWLDTRAGRETDIYGQKLGADGTPAWSHARFINESIGRIDQQNPAVAVDSGENTIVAWYSERGGQSNMFLQKFNSAGLPLWDRQIPASDAEIQGESLMPNLALLNDDILITWSDRRTAISRVYVQRFDPDGNRVWHSDQPASRITQDSKFSQFNPQIAVDTIGSNGSPDIFVAWQESDGTISRIAIQRLNGEGAFVFPEDQIVNNSNTATLQFPALALTNGEIVMAWTSTTLASTDLYLQTHNKSNGEQQNGPTRVNEFSGLVDQLNPPALAADPNGNTIVVWTDRRESAIYARGYNSQARSRWAAEKLNQTPGSFSPTPDIAFIPNTNNMVIVWQGLGQGQFFIYAQQVNADGETQWSVNALDAEMAIKVSGEGSQEAWLPAVAVGSSGISSIVWREERNMNQDIFLQRLNKENGVRRYAKDVVVIDSERFYRSEGIVKSRPIVVNNGDIGKALLTYEGDLKNGQVAFWFTDSQEKTFAIQPGEIYTFTPPSKSLRWQAHLTQTNVAFLDQSPLIDKIHIDSSNTTNATLPGDAYEPDNECDNAWAIQPNGIVQAHTLHNNATNGVIDDDWISFRADPNTDYIVLATPERDDATLQVDIYRSCPGSASTLIKENTGTQNNPAHLFLSELASQEYHVKISSEFAETIPYKLSIRTAPSSSQSVIIRGFHDTWDTQVDRSANRALATLRNGGFTQLYLNIHTDDVIQKLEEFAQQTRQTDADTVLIVYLVGQIDATGFKLLKDEYLTSKALDLWLYNLENAGKIRNAIVVIEADNSGSFIEVLSPPNRVIVTSTNAASRTEQTTRGFLFSDAFWLAMGQGYSVQQSFVMGRKVVAEFGTSCPPGAVDCLQIPLLADSSSRLAQSSGLIVADTQTFPVIKEHSVSRTQTASLNFTTTIAPPNSALYVEAHIRSARDDSGGIMESRTELSSNSSIEQYTGVLIPEPEAGRYYITVYGWDDSFALLPKTYEYYFESTYFPFISR